MRSRYAALALVLLPALVAGQKPVPEQDKKPKPAWPALSKKQLEEQCIAIDYSKAKVAHQEHLGLANDDYRARMLDRINARSFILRNKKRSFHEIQGMKRWVGTTINF